MRELINTFELEAVELPDGEPLRFRVEVFSSQQDELFFVRILRWESMRLRPSFAPENRSAEFLSADYSILVEDDSLAIHEISGTSPHEVLQAALARLSETLGIDLSDAV